VNQYVVNHEITKPITGDSEGDEKQIIHSALYTKIEKHDTGRGKNYEKYVVTLEGMRVFGLVMIGVKIPHEAVHNVLVGEPSDTFHD
jgi:hypothetical protein